MTRSSIDHPRPSWRRLVGVAVGVACLGGVGVAFAGSSTALAVPPVIGSKTSVTVNPATSVAGTSVTITSTTVDGNTGFGITPKGTVTFTAIKGTSSVTLGTAPLSSCLLKPCTASLTTTAIPAGSTLVKATYNGDAYSKPSSGTAAVTVTSPPPPPGGSQTVSCAPGQSCGTTTLTSSDQQTTLQVSTPPSGQSQTISASLSSGTLGCASPSFAGALATFTSTATDVGKTIDYTGVGTVGQEMFNQYAAHTTYVGCYASPTLFSGYTNGVYGPAQFNSADNAYEAALSSCANNNGALPCFVNLAGSGSNTYEVHTAPGDPKLIG